MEYFNLIGSGGHASVIFDTILMLGKRLLCVYDLNKLNSFFQGVEVKSVDSIKIDTKSEFIIAIGDNDIRKKVALKHSEVLFGSIIHPKSIVSNYVTIKCGTVIMGGAIINSKCEIGAHCIINSCAVVEHDCLINDFVHISPNATLCGNVSIGEGTHVGAGAVVIPGINIGKWAKIGAGAIIIRDVPDYVTVVGNPGKIIKTEKYE